MDELDRADVEAARRLGGDEHPRVAGDLAGDDALLLVAARQRRGERLGLAAADVELADQRARARRPCAAATASRAGSIFARAVLAQREVLGEREVEHEAAAVAVLGDVRDARRRPCRGRPRRCGRGPRRRSSPALDAPQAGDRLDRARSGRCRRPRPARRSRPRGRSGRRPARPAGRGRRARGGRGSRGPARRGSSGALSTRRSTSRPTIRRASDSSVAPSVATVSIRLPRRRTVTRSAISSTSPSLCEMKTIALPSSRSARSTVNRSCVSCAVSTAVGSSRTRICASR